MKCGRNLKQMVDHKRRWGRIWQVVTHKRGEVVNGKWSLIRGERS